MLYFVCVVAGGRSGVRCVVEASIIDVTHTLTPASFEHMLSTGECIPTSTQTSQACGGGGGGQLAKEQKTAENGSKETNAINAIKEKKWQSQTNVYAVTIVANGFLNHMMRRIIGTLREIGERKERKEKAIKTIHDIDHIFNCTKMSGPAAPARGLWRMGLEFHVLPDVPLQFLKNEKKHAQRYHEKTVHVPDESEKGCK